MKKWLICVLSVVLLLSLCAGALAQSTITATGVGQVQLLPDMASISLGVSVTDADVGKAMGEVNKRLDAVRASLKEAGVAEGDIAVSDIYMYTQFDYSGEHEQVVGYTISHQLTITARDTDRLGELIDKALAAGANQLSGVSFKASDSTEAYNKALALAVANARGRAEAMAAAEGLTLGAISAMSEGRAEYNVSGAMTASLEDGAGGGTQVDVGNLTVEAAVTVQFAAQ